jgi:hypothetical protein
MAPVVNLPSGFYQATIRMVGAAVPRGAAVVFGGLVPTTGTPTPTTVGNSVKTAFTTGTGIYSPGGAFTTQMTIVDVLVKFGPLDIGPSAVTSIGAQAGLAGGDPVAPNTSVLVSKFTALGGHVGRGRMFLPGFVESGVGAGGLISGAQVSALQSAVDFTYNTLISQGCPMYLLHRYDPAGTPPTSPRAPSAVTSMSVSGLVATQRNRLRR